MVPTWQQSGNRYYVLGHIISHQLNERLDIHTPILFHWLKSFLRTHVSALA